MLARRNDFDIADVEIFRKLDEFVDELLSAHFFDNILNFFTVITVYSKGQTLS